jgi:hypothetical protein
MSWWIAHGGESAMARYRPLSAEEIQILAAERRAYDNLAKVRSWAARGYGPNAARIEVEWEFEGDGEEGSQVPILGVSVMNRSDEFLSLDPDAPKTRGFRPVSRRRVRRRCPRW